MLNKRIGIRNGIEITTVNDTYPVFEGGNLIGAIELVSGCNRIGKIHASTGFKIV